MKKRIVSLLLCLLMILPTFFTVDFSSSAISYNAYKEKYTQFINDSRWSGASPYWNREPYIGYDPFKGCAAYASDFAAYVYSKSAKGGTLFGNANDIKTGDIIQFRWPYIPQSPASSNGEHWIVVLERNGSTLYTAEANFSGNGPRIGNYYIINNGVLQGSNYGYQSVTILSAYHFDIVTSHIHNYNTFAFYEAAHPHYNCYKCSCGDVQRRTSETNFIDTCPDCLATKNPGKPELIDFPEVSYDCYAIELNWNDTINTTHYNIYLQSLNSDGNYTSYESFHYAEKGLLLTNLPVGKYRIQIQSTNSKYWTDDGSTWRYTDGDWKYFEVKEFQLYTTKENYTFDLGGIDSDYLSIEWSGKEENLSRPFSLNELVVESSDPNIAEVYRYQSFADLFRIVAKNVGKTTITVKAKNYSTTCNVTVINTYEKNYKLVFKSSGTKPDTVVSKNGATIDLSKYTSSRNCYTFLGWYKEGDANKTILNSVTLNEDTTLVANFKFDKHTYKEEVVKEATCTEDGEIKYTCIHDGYTTTKTVKAKGHTFGDWVITKAATCTAAGTRQHTCSVCKTVESESYRLETTAHKYGDWTVIKYATCIEDGLRERNCIYCSYVQKNVLSKEQYGDHAWEPGRIEPTCTEGGHECFICKYCGDMQLGAWIPPIDHKYEKTVVPANCTESGYTVYTCSVCGNSYASDYTSAKGHKYTVTVTDPTCTEDGYTTHTCTVCGDSYITNRVPAPGHNFGDWTIAKPATETENGLKQRICRTCGEVESEVIPMTGDNHEANCPSKDMTDVIKTAWYHKAVDYVLEKGYFAGISKTSFEPNTVMSRAMLVQVLYKMEGSPKVAFKLTFSDVKAGQWYSNAVIWAADNDIVAGLGNGKFDPTGEITREQLAVILYNYSMKKGRDVTARGDLSRFSDAGSTSSWAKTAVEWAVGEGLISGTNVGLEPKGKASRAQVAQILMNYEK